METTHEIKDPLLLANRIVEESRGYREICESALVEIAWEYSNAANARLNADLNSAGLQIAGLDQRLLIESPERAIATELAARDAFVKEFKSYLLRRDAVAN